MTTVSIEIRTGQLAHVTGHNAIVKVYGSTVRECLDELVKMFPGVARYLFDRNGILMVVVLVDDKMVLNNNLDKQIADGHNLSLFPIIGGG